MPAADHDHGNSTPGAASAASRPLLKNTLYSVTGHACYHLCQLGVLVLLAKFASPQIQGQYLFALAVATPVILLFGLELRGAFVADVSNQFTFGSYHALRQVMLLPAALLLAGFVAWRAATATPALCLLLLVGVFAAKIAWSAAEVGWGTFQRRERLDLLAASVALRGLTLILPFAVLLPLCAGSASPERRAQGTALAVLLHAAGTLLVWLLFDRPRTLDRSRWDLRWTWPALRALAIQTFPLGLVALTINLCDTVPRLLLEREPGGAAQLGYFGSLAYITLAGNLIVIQAATAAANRLSLYYQRDLRAFLRLGGMLSAAALGIGVAVLTVALLFGGWILRVLYTPEYAAYETEFQIVVLAHCLTLLTNVFGTATTQMRVFWPQVPIQVLTLLTTVVAAVLLIPGDTPVRGAAWTALVRAVVQFVLYAACVGLGLAFRHRVLGRK